MIAVDWGTSSFRAYRLDGGGNVLDKRESADGILAARDFAKVLAEKTAGWRERPIVMSGMVGSRQGWREAPYVECPAGLQDLRSNLLEIEKDVFIVPGVICREHVPDVMRGEETQILGSGITDGTICLPGTHSKWVEVQGGKIVRFSTHMTGEVFAVMKEHSILGRMMEGKGDSFLEGVARSEDEGGLLHHLFGVRTRALMGGLADPASYLSGILIGHELRAAGNKSVKFLGTEKLVDRYVQAAGALGIETQVLDPQAGVRALFELGRSLSRA